MSMSATWPTSSGSRTCSGERLTVTVDRRLARVAALPLRGLLPTASASTKPADLGDEPGLLGHRDEGVRRQQPELGCCQRTSASKATGRPVASSMIGW